MVFEYVQTWMVREGFDDVHDSLLREWILRIKDNPYLRGVRYPPLTQRASRKRVLVFIFDDVQGWRCFREETMEYYRVFVDQWLPLIERSSFKIFLWSSNKT